MGSSSPFSLTWLLSLSPTTTLTLSSAQSNGNCRRFGSSPSFLVLSLPLLPGSSAVPSSCPTVVSSRDTAASSTFFSSKSPLPRTGSSSSPVVAPLSRPSPWSLPSPSWTLSPLSSVSSVGSLRRSETSRCRTQCSRYPDGEHHRPPQQAGYQAREG